MPIAIAFIGAILTSITDKNDPLRATKAVLYVSSFGGLLWLVGIVLSFFEYGLLKTGLILLGTFAIGALVSPRLMSLRRVRRHYSEKSEER